MKDSEALLRLQEIDIELMRNRRTLAAMPQTKKIQAVAAARKKLAQQLSKVVGQRKDAQMEVDDNARSLQRLHEVVDEVQARYEGGSVGYRELADLESQLTSLAKRIEKREFKGREYEARLADAQVAEASARAMDEKLLAEGRAQLASLREQTAGIEQDIAALEAERGTVAASVDAQDLERYEAARRRFDGLAVERLSGDKPSVCRVTIPPSSMGEIRRGPAVTECPYCHRILVVG